MKYKLINRKTNEEHLCEKVTIDGWDYYVSGEVPKIEDYGLTKLNTITKIGYGFDYKLYKKVIATNDPSIDIPKVVDEVDELELQLRQANVTDNDCKHEGGKIRGELYSFQICTKCGEEY